MTTDPVKTLADLRRSIDNIDAALVHILAERFRCTQAVGKLKATHDMPPLITIVKNGRWNACVVLPRTRTSIQISPRLS